MRRFSFALVAMLVIGAAAGKAQTMPPAPTAELCLKAVATAEKANGIPPRLLIAINRVESGRLDEVTGAVRPWPWTVNAEGRGYFYRTKAEAIAAVIAMQTQGTRSIDIGCGQINLMYHPAAFRSLEQAFDPDENAAYAAQFLKALFAQTGDWGKAAGLYHSATPELGVAYEHKVMAAWPYERQRRTAPVGVTLLARAWGATLTLHPLPEFKVIHLPPPRPLASPRTVLLSAADDTVPASVR